MGMAEYRWLIYAALSALCASFVGIFGKLGMKDIDSNLATAVRSVVMTILLLLFCTTLGLWSKVSTLWHGRALTMIALSGAAGALSWIFYFKAIQLGDVSKVAPIDKLSMPVAIVLAVLLLGERPAAINWVGIALIVCGAYLAAMKVGA